MNIFWACFGLSVTLVFGYTSVASAQSATETLAYYTANGVTQNDYIVMKICIDTNNGNAIKHVTPVQCNQTGWQLRDVQSTDSIFYVHSDFEPVTYAYINKQYCRTYFGDVTQYMFPLPTNHTGSDNDSGTYNGASTNGTSYNEGNTYPLYVHWEGKTLYEYIGNSALNCQLQNQLTYDSFGLLTLFDNTPNSSIYWPFMTLMGTDLACTASDPSCVVCSGTAPSSCTYGSGESTVLNPREYAWGLGNGYSYNATGAESGIQNFNSAVAAPFLLGSPGHSTAYEANLGKFTLTQDAAPKESPGPDIATAIQNSLRNVTPDASISYNREFNFTFGPDPNYGAYNTYFPMNSAGTGGTSPGTGMSYNYTTSTVLQIGYQQLINGNADAPAPYTPGNEDTAAGVSEHIYSTREYGYATRWELWNEVDLAPTLVINAVKTYNGLQCSPPAFYNQTPDWMVNNDFIYGSPQIVQVYLTQDPATLEVESSKGLLLIGPKDAKQPQKITSSGMLNLPYLYSKYGTFSFGDTAAGPNNNQYIIEYWDPSQTNLLAATPVTSSANLGNVLVIDNSDNVWYKAYDSGTSGTGKWYEWIGTPAGGPYTGGSWMPMGSTAPLFPSSPTQSYIYSQNLTDKQNGVTNVWVMVGCDDYTNAWSDGNYNNIVPSDEPQFVSVSLPYFPDPAVDGSTGPYDFAHVIGTDYLASFNFHNP